MGEYYKLMEYKNDLYKFIRELECKRVEEDLLNHNKYDCLYEVYHRVCEGIVLSRELINGGF